MKQKSTLPTYVKIIVLIILVALVVGIALAFSNIEKDLKLMLIGFGLIVLGIVGIFVLCFIVEKRRNK